MIESGCHAGRTVFVVGRFAQVQDADSARIKPVPGAPERWTLSLRKAEDDAIKLFELFSAAGGKHAG